MPESPPDPGDSTDLTQVGGNTGVPPSGEKSSAPHPVIGIKPPKTPSPSAPRPEQPVAFDPAEDVVTTINGENEVYNLPKPLKKDADADLADPRKPGGPSDYDDPNETDPEHVMNQLRSNFPEEKIQWVKRARWVGPIEVPFERIDTDSIDTWASSHQPDAVNRFARDIKANRGHANPSVLVQRPGNPKALIIDGHHRALARKKLGKPVLAYVGFIQANDALAAEEAHSSQFHGGADPGNK